MLTTSHYLTTRRPSPTTVEYIVSNAPLSNTIAARILQYLLVSIRICLGFLTVVILNAKIQFQPPKKVDTSSSAHRQQSQFGSKLSTIDLVATGTSWQVLLPFSTVLLFLCFRRFYTGKAHAKCLSIIISSCSVLLILSHVVEKQMNPYLFCAHLVFKPLRPQAHISVHLRRASSQRLRSKIFSSMKHSRGLKFDTILP